MPFVVGETIGPYRILTKLGSGGMATVFKAYHPALDRYVAIKALHPAFLEDPNFLARFEREARVVAKLEHPNIVPIYDFAEHEGRPYLVMKFIEGETLKARLNHRGIDQADLIKVIKAVGASLSYAHQKGILHRDVKPSNVLLGYDGRIYLADFGLARIAQAGESTLSTDMMLGTPQYISPEQAMGLGELDKRTDIYSLGVMLYEMTVGKVPFSADTPFSIIHDHIYTPLPLPSAINPDVSESVERVLLKALAKERDDRYPSANDLAEAFHKAILVEPGVVPENIPSTPDATHLADSLDAVDPRVVSESVTTQKTKQIALDTPAPKERYDGQDKARVSQVETRFRWWYIPIGIALFIASCIGGLVVYDSLIGFPDRGTPSAEQFPQVRATKPITGPGSQSDGWFEEIPLPDAQARIEDDPENPYAWLDLAKAQWQVGQVDEARDTLDRALKTAGNDPDFYYNAAEELAAGEIWVEAAHVYLDGILRFNQDGVPEDISNGFREAVYRGAEYPMAEMDIPISKISNVDPALERVAKARYEYYQGNPGEAERIIEEVLTRINPGMPEAMLMKSEMYYDWGEGEQAINIIFDLLGRDDIPPWMQDYLGYSIEDSLDQLDEAQRLVDENPNDPYLHLDLYAEFLALGMRDEAESALEQALRLGGENPDVPNMAGDIAVAHGNWLEAAQLYAQAVKLSPEGAPPKISEKLIESLYYGAAEEGAPEVFAMLEPSLPDDGPGSLRPLLRDTLIARYKLYYEDAGEAEVIVKEVLRRAPNLPLARLVQAEVYMFFGDLDQSKRILLSLEEDRDLPTWMREEIGFLLEYIILDL